jgi:UDP-N-acetylglucosamine--dolichyl-phosphate N-acetylglucosaminephosphotransferase
LNRKLVLPTIAALPLLMAYAGGTSIIIPKPLASYVGVEVLELGMSANPNKWNLAQ